METFSTRQLACIASANKTVTWNFRITDNLDNTYYWSTGTQASSGSETVVSGALMAPGSYTGSEWERAHTFKIVNFGGITLRRSKSESGIHAPNDVSFSIVNSGNVLDAVNFSGGTVRIGLVIDDGSGKELCGSWRFRIKSASPYAQQIDVTCEDFLQEYLQGSYPNTRLISDIFPVADGVAPDSMCIPEPYGTAYIPLRSVYAGAARYYILGDPANTFTIDEVRSPRELGAKITWTSAGFTFQQSTVADGAAVNWRMFQAMIADGNPGIFMSGDRILDVPTKFRRSDTQGDLKTNLLLYSEQFDNAAWNKSNVTVNANATTAPDGTMTAERITPTGAGLSFVTQGVTGIVGVEYTFSVYAKKDISDRLIFEWHSATWAENTLTVFDLTNGVVVSGADGDGITPVGNGWYRCYGKRTAISTSISNAFFIDQYPTGGVGNSIFLWGAQCEVGESSSPYIPTTSAAVSQYYINPAEVIRRVLRNMGLLDYDLDLASFDVAKETFIAWNLRWNFALYYKEDRKAVLSRLLTMCHSALVIGEKIRLQVLSKTSQATVTNAEVLKPQGQDVGQDTFRYVDAIAERTSDSGYVAFQQTGESQDQFLKILVPAKSATDVKDGEVITFPGVQDTQQVQKLGTLYYQRKFLKAADVSFTGKGTLLALRPDDVITVNYADYGGSYNVLIDELTINPDVSVSISAIRFSEVLDDWEDLVPGAITIASDTPTTAYSPVISGPDSTPSSGNLPNTLPGRLRVGASTNYILLEPASPLRVSLYSADTERLRIGNLNGFLGYVTDLYGLAIGSAAKYLKYDSTNGLRLGGSGVARIELDLELARISVKDATDATKTAMGYLNGLAKNDGTGNWGAGDYGFWAAAGDNLKIDGDAVYKSGDWIVENDGSYLIQNAAAQTIIRLGTVSGVKGLYIYDATSPTQLLLAKFATDGIFIGDASNYFEYTTANAKIQAGYTAPGDDDTTAGAGLKIDAGKIEAYGGDHTFGGTIMSSDGNYMVLIGKQLTATGLTKRYPLNNATNMTADGQIHLYHFETTDWKELLDLGTSTFGSDVGVIGVRIRNSQVGIYAQDMTGNCTYGEYIILPSSVGGTAGSAGKFINLRSGESIGIEGTGKYGGKFSAKTGGEGGPIVLAPSTDAPAPSHSAEKGTLWATSACVLYINKDGSTTWEKVGAQ